MFWRRVEESGDLDAQLVKRAGAWRALRWREVGEAVREAALGLLALGCRPGERIAPDRKKEIIVTSGGANIAPQYVENPAARRPPGRQAMLHGDRRPYPTALIAVNAEEVARFARERGIGVTDYAALSRTPTQKVKRKVVTGEYRDLIESLCR